MNLLSQMNTVIFPTSLSRKMTLNGVTKAYPVYRIDLGALYYNDQNDRIATWISQYKEEHGKDSLEKLSKSEYNTVIEKFVVSSNPASIEKTQMNIELVGQREPGVVLNDGRVIDGNRRYTCIRRLSQKNNEFRWFEAVILDVDIHDSKKMIKMLELTIQHGEEKRIDYNHVERLIGVYQDIVETELLSIEEYAMSTNESISDVKKRVEAAKILVEFLNYIGLPKQYHIAREYQIVALINDLQDLLKKCSSKEMVEQVKQIVFCNILMDTIGEERKYIKNLSTMISNGLFDTYAQEQHEIEEKILKRLHMQQPEHYIDLKAFVRSNDDISDELIESLDQSLTGAKRQETHNKPAQIVSKTINSLRDIDLRIIEKLTPLEKEKIQNQVERLSILVSKIEQVTIGEKEQVIPPLVTIQKPKRFFIIPTSLDEWIIFEEINKKTITSLCFNLSVKLKEPYENGVQYVFFFVNKENEVCSNIIENYKDSSSVVLKFDFHPKISQEKEVYLAIKRFTDKNDEVRLLLTFNVNLSFGCDVDF